MLAAVVDRFGPPEVVRVEAVPTPSPGRGEVRVRVVAAAVTVADQRIRAARFPRGFGLISRLVFGFRKPRTRVLGSAFSGVVDAVGADVTSPRPGDEVCGMRGGRMGAHAEFIALPAAKAVPKPASVSHEDAAGMLFGGTTALHFLRDKVDIRRGTTVLVIGASGAVGTNAVQLAKHYGGTVTAVTSGRNRELVLSLGADRVIDYRATPVASIEERFDVVVDTVGELSLAEKRGLLTPGGTVLLVAGDLAQNLGARGNVKAGVASEKPADMAFLLSLMEAGALSSVTDSIHEFRDIAAAHARVDSGRKVGNVIVRMPSA